ncbi:leucine-rich repeat neuronal protein 4-like [Scleropages formosus]|uniref:Leucine-rich repeat neuronal protein 4-like n=1 Tax=Scleropages formosus TaxID=113540 RepID=A0A8C9T3T4_SCLFO|nr:leucine-rich repeat neuronal protein 4-like [Scleropages formosus]
MTPCGNLSAFLVLLALGLFGGCSAYNVSLLGGKDESTPMRILDDRDRGPDRPRREPNPTSRSGIPELCDYDPCRDQQRPCAELSELSGCRCPGLSGQDEPPEAPFLQMLTQEGPGVLVQWCAPPSYVLQYKVLAEGHEPVVLGSLFRRTSLPHLEPGARVCVEAVNLAGTSGETASSCARYEPSGDGRLALKAGLVAGGLGLLLLLSLLGLLLWRRRSGRKSGARGPARDSEGPL